MIRAFVRVGALLFFSSIGVQAVEELPQASATASSGYAVFYTGLCAERVGLKVLFGARGDGGGLEGLVQQARASVSQVLDRCPQAQEIVADVRSRRDPTNAAYFTMERVNDWEPSSPVFGAQLVSTLEAAGYRTIAGPRPLYAKAYWRLERDRFELVYGNDLENRMVATHFERHGPDEYRVRGQLYELGYGEAGRRCDTSREGYPLWGSFTLEVSPDLRALPLAIDWCPGAEGPTHRENTELFELPWHGAEASRPESASVLLGRSLATASVTRDVKASSAAGSRQPLVDREFYRVYATHRDLCSNLEFDVLYRVNHERRDSVFADDYGRAISNIVGSLGSRRCGSAARFTVNAYQVGDPAIWDSITFEFNETLAAAGEVPFRAVRRRASERALAFDAQRERNRFGACEGPFCEYSGGRYLNAIYRGELDVVRQIDGLHREAVEQFLRQQRSALRGTALQDAYDALVGAAGETQLLQQFANKYMHAYGMWGEGCLDPGAEAKEYAYTTPVIIETDEYGTTTSGGDTFATTYTLNPEFFPLRDQLASHKGAPRSDAPTNLDVKASIYQGLVRLIETGDCRSPQVKQFERQLLTLTEVVLRDPGVLVPSAAVRPALPERVMAPAFALPTAESEPPIAWNPPAPLPAFAPSTGAREGRSVPMTREERYAQVNDEMRKAQEKLEADMAAIRLRMSNAQKMGASQAELMKLVQDSQREMLELQQAFQQELFRLQQQLQ